MNVLIVEDEMFTAKLLAEIIEQDSDFLVVEKLESVGEAVQYLDKYQQNLSLLFFDIELADGRSFEIFNNVDVVTPVIFCTAYDTYILQAIKNNSIDYILKPFREEEVHLALTKFKRLASHFQNRHGDPIRFMSEPRAYQQNFIAQSREKSIVKRVDEIAAFAVEFEMVYLYTFKGEKFPIFKKLEYIESVCDPYKFFRINRKMLIHRDAVNSFEPYHNRRVILQLTSKLEESPIISRMKVFPFKKWIES